MISKLKHLVNIFFSPSQINEIPVGASIVVFLLKILPHATSTVSCGANEATGILLVVLTFEHNNSSVVVLFAPKFTVDVVWGIYETGSHRAIHTKLLLVFRQILGIINFFNQFD